MSAAHAIPVTEREPAAAPNAPERILGLVVGWWERGSSPQLLALGGALAAYVLVGLLSVDDLATAQAHATWIVDLERATGTDVEGPVQRALDAAPVATLLSAVYLLAQFVVVPLALLLVHHRAATTTYRTFRDTLLLTWAAGMLTYALFPVAPPRMSAAAGVTDVVSSHSPVDLAGSSSGLFNQLAAVPSMHVAFALAVSVALWSVARGPLLRVVAVVWAPLVITAVIATGNHFTFDAAAGALVVGVAALLVVALRGRVVPRGRPAG